jgi:pyruvate dehydrogenase E1 component alpha subunit
MHITEADMGILGSYAIVGSHLPIAAGAAGSAKLHGARTGAVASLPTAQQYRRLPRDPEHSGGLGAPSAVRLRNNFYMEHTPSLGRDRSARTCVSRSQDLAAGVAGATWRSTWEAG